MLVMAQVTIGFGAVMRIVVRIGRLKLCGLRRQGGRGVARLAGFHAHRRTSCRRDMAACAFDTGEAVHLVELPFRAARGSLGTGDTHQ